ncbi:secreted protein [Melampsora americana]|nr:secreted protein [Melampsora americana]
MRTYSLQLVIGFSAIFFRPSQELTVSQPQSGTVWHLHSSNQVQWKSVQTDPSSIAIKLVNNNPSTYPTGFSQEVKDGINTADNKFTLDKLPGIKPGKGYQVNIMSSEGTILAQSAQFAINGSTEATKDHDVSNNPTTVQPTVSAPSASASASASDASMIKEIPGIFTICLCSFFGLIVLL